ncbi:uncharacterized protein LY89DRAFT_698593 [Mollisia scopiformis]|uniref:Aminoglycoside phosphotransferase domain-containing protein n=1 Tax=Mollisia scopiformis TaxID=149040 RepID=A0A194X1S7_MOLSC|nr:uncharacterized protein LY89DRAFT_698593 [Mollisia scopiformis]KUJ14155.1 hypothetical protein LY89DRAFT_698593 [Mollisia scopiformis]
MSEDAYSNCDNVDSGADVKLEVEKLRIRFPRNVIRDKREFDNTYHPGIESADLVHMVHDVRVSKRDRGAFAPMSGEACRARGSHKQLCHNCGWTTTHQLGVGGYTSRLKVFHLRGNSAIWDLGPNGPWMLRDEPNNPTSVWETDYVAQQFLREEKPNMPLVEMHKFGGPNDKFHFTIMSRAKGSTIEAIWDTLTEEQKNDVRQDLTNCIKEWRQITRPHMQKVDGSELRDPFLGYCNSHACIKTGRDEEQWLENLTPAMRKGFLSDLWFRNGGENADQDTMTSWIKEADEKVAQLKANFPRGGPYVLTHGDLHSENVFISDDNEEKKYKVSAIIDWELAGFYPWWAERRRSDLDYILGVKDLCHPGYSVEDYEKVFKPVSQVSKAWRRAGNHTSSVHKPEKSKNRWFGPPFCACQPWPQEYRDVDLGLEEDEHLDIFDVDSTDSEDDEEDGRKKFPKYERDFLRWFNKINNHKSKHASLD